MGVCIIWLTYIPEQVKAEAKKVRVRSKRKDYGGTDVAEKAMSSEKQTSRSKVVEKSD